MIISAENNRNCRKTICWKDVGSANITSSQRLI